MEVSQAVALRDPVGWLPNRLPTAVGPRSGLITRCRPAGSCRGVARKRRERQHCNWACPPRGFVLVRSAWEGAYDGSDDDRDRPAQGVARRGGGQRRRTATGQDTGEGLPVAGSAAGGMGGRVA